MAIIKLLGSSLWIISVLKSDNRIQFYSYFFVVIYYFLKIKQLLTFITFFFLYNSKLYS